MQKNKIQNNIKELTPTGIITGVLMAVLFGGANAYLGLRVGMTVSASIPAAVISMGITRVLLKRDSILENNIVQTIGSAGESLAAGAIFTLPALFMWAAEGKSAAPSFINISLISLCGGILGVLFMVPLRNALIVKEHGTLPYPEGHACAKVLSAGERGESRTSSVFWGLGISAAYKFAADGLKLFKSEVDFSIKGYRGAGIGCDVLPALAGVGYICGIKISSYIFAGGVVAWLSVMPLISLFGGENIVYPSSTPIFMMNAWDLWRNYMRYIGAGAVAAGGIISLVKTLPLIINTFKKAFRAFSESGETIERTAVDIPMKWVLFGIASIALLMWALPFIPVNFIGAFVIIIFGFFFATVSSRMVGLVGSSNNPVSGMAIATLLIASFILKLSGADEGEAMVSSITIGSVICIIAAMAGDTSQDLKTGYILGATPRCQQIGELLGGAVSAVTIGGVLYLLNLAWGFGSTQLPAPQAMLMKMLVEGVVGGNLPWGMVWVGVFLAVGAEILHLPVLPFAIGLYLPVHLSTPIFLGGVLKYITDRRKYKNEEEAKEGEERGILYTSGLIAGEGLVGILLAVLAVIPAGSSNVGEMINLSEKGFSVGNTGSIILFLLLLYSILKAASVKGDKHAREKLS